MVLTSRRKVRVGVVKRGKHSFLKQKYSETTRLPNLHIGRSNSNLLSHTSDLCELAANVT